MSEWDALRLGSLVSIRKGKLARLSPNPKDGFLPYLGAGALEGRIEAFAETSSAELATNKDVLMLWDGERSGLVGKGYEGVVASTVARLTPKDGVDTAFLFHALGHKFEWIQARRTGTGVPHVPKDLCDILIVPIPKSAGEQRAIAAILDAADEAIAKTEALIAKLKSIKQGLLHDLLTRGLDDNGELRDPDTNEAQFNKTPLGVRPKEWQVRPLGQVLLEIGGRLQTGPFGSQLHAHEYQPDGVPVIMPENIQDGRIELQSIARVSEAKATAMARHRISAGDIVFARRGDLSRAAATSEREQGWLCGTGCFLLRLPSGTVNPFWLAEVYRSVYVQRQVEARSVGSTMLSLNNTVMESLLIGWPTKAEQDAIMARLDEWSQRIAGESAYLSKLKGIKKALMQDLLTGRVRVPGDKAPTFATG